MNILITGGAGYVGTELMYLLAARADVTKVVVYDNLSRGNYNSFIGVSKLPAGKAEFIEGDILDTRKLKKLVDAADVVYHLAAHVSTPFADQNPHLFEQINHWGTAEITYMMENRPEKKLIFSSSVSVYGASSDESDTQSELNPRTFYGISKMRGEEHVQRIASKIPVFVLRLGNVYGYSKSMRFDAVINRFVFDANFKKRIRINGNGNQSRSFVHIKHASQLMASLCNGSELKPGTYNVVDQIASVNDIAYTLKELYPELEMIFVNQQLKLRDLKVLPDNNVNRIFSEPVPMKEALTEFMKAFTF
jgi:UDP-glucose 4-epimerase